MGVADIHDQSSEYSHQDLEPDKWELLQHENGKNASKTNLYNIKIKMEEKHDTWMI